MQKFFFFILSIVSTAFLSQAQPFDEKDFIHYTTKNGLSDNYITALEQDDQGYLWIGTEVGLDWYDSHMFSHYSPSLNKHRISGNINRLKKFSAGKLGIVSRNGFYVLRQKDFTIKKYEIADSTSFSAYLNSTWDAQELPDNSFAVTSSTGFYVFDQTGKVKFRYDAYHPGDEGKTTIRYGRDIFSINGNEYIVYFNIYKAAYYNPQKKNYREIDPSESQWNFFSLSAVPDANHWITKFQLSANEFIFIPIGKDTIVYYDHNTKKRVKSPLPFHPGSELNSGSKITMLSDSSFVLNGSNNGFWLLKFDRKTGKISCNGIKYLPGYKINSMVVDKERRLWIGTSEGLLQQRMKKPLLQVFTLTPEMLKDTVQKNLFCAYRYKDKLYLGRFARNSGLVILDTGTFRVIKTINFFGGENGFNEITTIEMYHEDTLWLGSNNGLMWLDTKTNSYGRLADNKKFPNEVSKLNLLSPVRKDGYAWIAAYLGGMAARYHPGSRSFQFFKENTTPSLPFKRIKKIIYDAYGDAWLSGHALARWNNNKQIFDTMMTVYGGPNKFNDNIVLIEADDHGSLWLHNVENGLLEYGINQKRFIHYGINEGLPNDHIQSMSPIVDNVLWIAQKTSISRFNILSKKITTYSYNDGLPIHKSTSPSIYYDSLSQTCYLLCKNDVVKFPFNPTETNNQTSDVIIHKFIVNNNKTIYHPERISRLKHNENNLTIHYTILDFESGNDYSFAYRLNETQDWIHLGNQRSITLADLRNGRHTINFKSISKSGEEKIKTLSFTISPPFWKTGWFLFLSIAVFLYMLYFIYRFRIKQVRQKSNIDRLLAKTEMKALHSQMNPHFVFNSLNSIREMILNNENNHASHYLSKFAQLIRISLDQSSHSFISLRNTVDYLHRYIEMEQIRNNNFTHSINIDEALDQDETLMPPMLIQPFIENSIWHGPGVSNEIIHIAIDFRKNADHFICTINDNGVGIENPMKQKREVNVHRPLGISNIRNRIKLLNEKYKLQCSINIHDKSILKNNQETGTLVILQLPLEIPEE